MRATNASFLLLAAAFGVLAVGTKAMDLGEGWKKGSEEMLVGGYKELEDLERFQAEIMPQVVQAYKVQAAMSNAMLYEDDFHVCKVKSQVVAGTNYVITVSTDAEGCAEGNTADLRVFCPLPVDGGLCELTEPVLLPTHFFAT